MDGGITEMAARNLKRPFTRVLIDQVRLATIRNTTIRSGIVLGKHNSYLADIIGNLVDHLKDPNYYTYVLKYDSYIHTIHTYVYLLYKRTVSKIKYGYGSS